MIFRINFSRIIQNREYFISYCVSSQINSPSAEESLQLQSAFSPMSMACIPFPRNLSSPQQQQHHHHHHHHHMNRKFLSAPYTGTGYLPTIIRPSHVNFPPAATTLAMHHHSSLIAGAAATIAATTTTVSNDLLFANDPSSLLPPPPQQSASSSRSQQQHLHRPNKSISPESTSGGSEKNYSD